MNRNIKNNNKKKKWKVKFHERVLKKLENVPDNVAEEIEQFVIGIKRGEIDPATTGHPVNWVELDIRLRCPTCGSKEVKWLLDKNSNEVTFFCLLCDESFWMTHEEYKAAVNKNQDCII